MRILRMFTVVMLTLLLSSPAWASKLAIPEFTPNVVDPRGYLDAAGNERVNLELQRIRGESHIWGAVFLVDTLGGEPIENVAVEAFEQWKLGQAGVDNGLLLVLAVDDRKSRFEVGYGLEGAIPDVAALRALDAHLAPRMREGDTAGAIVEAFGFLSRVVAQDPGALQELQAATDEGDEFHWRAGLTALGAYLAALWLVVPVRNAWVGHRRQRVLEEQPVLGLRDDEVVKSGAQGGGRWRPNLFILGFLSLNPGVFVLLLSALLPGAYEICLAVPPLLAALVVYLSGRKYASPERYQKFLDGVAKQRAEMISKGHVQETSPGVFSYTAAYHASRASSSSSGRSSYSSSSGGGRSGGGGASSGW